MIKASLLRIIALLSLVSSLCSPAAFAMPDTSMPLAECKQTLDSLKTLMQGLPLPEHFNQPNPRRQGNEFDPMRYFTVFRHLSMLPGERIDYVYLFLGGGGRPLLYTRPADAAPLADAAAFEARFGKQSPPILDPIRTDGSPQGWFELATFHLVAPHFYLRWHEGARFQMVACDAAEVMPFVWEREIPAAIAALQARDLAPSIEMQGDEVIVELTVVRPQGVTSRVRLRINTKAPHRVIEESRSLLFSPAMLAPM